VLELVGDAGMLVLVAVPVGMVVSVWVGGTAVSVLVGGMVVAVLVAGAAV
jgi:hypothetical protein